MKRSMVILLVLALMLALFSGCGKKAAEEDIALPIAAYQYAKGEIQTRLPIPSSAVFPQYTDGSLDISLPAENKVQISGTVAHRDPAKDAIITTNFTVVVVHQGKGLWKIESLEFHK